MPDQIICGIDIGSSKVATVVGIESKEGEDPRIIGFNTTPARGVKKGLIVDIDQVAAVVEESVEKAERMSGHKIKSAFVSIGGPHISSLNSHGVVGRAGANTFFELLALEKPCVFIPLPWSAYKEQQKQAQIFKDNKMGEVFNQAGKSEELLALINKVIKHRSTYKKNFDNLKFLYKENAAHKIVKEIFSS